MSVDYLTRPVEVFRDSWRACSRPGGPFVCTFSNRCFPTKAIRGWLYSSDEQHCEIVAEYFHRSGAFQEPVIDRRTPRASRRPSLRRLGSVGRLPRLMKAYQRGLLVAAAVAVSVVVRVRGKGRVPQTSGGWRELQDPTSGDLVLVVGLGETGVRTARQLLDTRGVDRVFVAGRTESVSLVAEALHDGAEAWTLSDDAMFPPEIDAIVSAVPCRAHDARPSGRRRGIPFASVADHDAAISALLALDEQARAARPCSRVAVLRVSPTSRPHGGVRSRRRGARRALRCRRSRRASRGAARNGSRARSGASEAVRHDRRRGDELDLVPGSGRCARMRVRSPPGSICSCRDPGVERVPLAGVLR